MTAALTAVVLVDQQRERGARALQALCSQTLNGELEILILDFAPPTTAPLEGSTHRSVRVLRQDPSLGYGGGMALAAREARAPLVAFVEEHVLVLDGWAQALVTAHRGPWAAVCPEESPNDDDRPIAKRLELMGRYYWSPPARRGESPILRWHNVCYKKANLMRYGDLLAMHLTTESTLFRQLRLDGERLFVEPAARIIHAHEHTWRQYLRAAFHSARLGAVCVVRARQLRAAGKLGHILRQLAGTVYWPYVLWKRTQELPNPQQWLRTYYRNLFFVFQYYTVSALGGLVGTVAGKGDSDRRLLLYELNGPRREVKSYG